MQGKQQKVEIVIYKAISLGYGNRRHSQTPRSFNVEKLCRILNSNGQTHESVSLLVTIMDESTIISLGALSLLEEPTRDNFVRFIPTVVVLASLVLLIGAVPTLIVIGVIALPFRVSIRYVPSLRLLLESWARLLWGLWRLWKTRRKGRPSGKRRGNTTCRSTLLHNRQDGIQIDACSRHAWKRRYS
jgi:hypothetical protein